MEDLAPKGFSLNDTEGASQLSINVNGGKVELLIWPKEKDPNQRGPAFKEGFTFDGQVIFRRLMNDIINAGPGVKHNITFSEWDVEAKASKLKSSIVIGKNDKQVIFIEVQYKKDDGTSRTYTYPVRSPMTLATGADPLDEPARSKIRATAILQWLEGYAPVACALTSKKFKRSGGGGGGNYSGNRNSGGGGGGNSGGGGGDSFGGGEANW